MMSEEYALLWAGKDGAFSSASRCLVSDCDYIVFNHHSAYSHYLTIFSPKKLMFSKVLFQEKTKNHVMIPDCGERSFFFFLKTFRFFFWSPIYTFTFPVSKLWESRYGWSVGSFIMFENVNQWLEGSSIITHDTAISFSPFRPCCHRFWSSNEQKLS